MGIQPVLMIRGFDVLNIEHSAPWRAHIALSLWGGSGLAWVWRWPEITVTSGRAGIHCLCELPQETGL